MHEIEQDFRDQLEEIFPLLQKSARGLCRDGKTSPDDLTSRVVLKMLEREAQFSPGSDILNWGRQIMRNEFYTTAKRGKREVEDPDETLALQLRAVDNPERVCVAKDQISFIGLLPAQMAQALVLSIQGFSIEEIGAQLEIATGTVKSKINRARQMLLDLGFSGGDGI